MITVIYQQRSRSNQQFFSAVSKTQNHLQQQIVSSVIGLFNSRRCCLSAVLVVDGNESIDPESRPEQALEALESRRRWTGRVARENPRHVLRRRPGERVDARPDQAVVAVVGLDDLKRAAAGREGELHLAGIAGLRGGGAGFDEIHTALAEKFLDVDDAALQRVIAARAFIL